MADERKIVGFLKRCTPEEAADRLRTKRGIDAGHDPLCRAAWHAHVLIGGISGPGKGWRDARTRIDEARGLLMKATEGFGKLVEPQLVECVQAVEECGGKLEGIIGASPAMQALGGGFLPSSTRTRRDDAARAFVTTLEWLWQAADRPRLSPSDVSMIATVYGVKTQAKSTSPYYRWKNLLNDARRVQLPKYEEAWGRTQKIVNVGDNDLPDWRGVGPDTGYIHILRWMLGPTPQGVVTALLAGWMTLDLFVGEEWDSLFGGEE